MVITILILVSIISLQNNCIKFDARPLHSGTEIPSLSHALDQPVKKMEVSPRNQPNLFRPEVLHKVQIVRQKFDDPEIVLEGEPDHAKVQKLLRDMDNLTSPDPLWNSFRTSHRDGTVCVRHTIPIELSKQNGYKDLFEPQILAVHIDLFTVTQDYTWRCPNKFSESKGWVVDDNMRLTIAKDALSAQQLIEIVTPLFNKAQIFLLTKDDAYLHRIFRFRNLDRNEMVYTIEVAKRYKAGMESAHVNIPADFSIRKAKWDLTDPNNSEHHQRVPSTAEEVTLWALQDATPPKENHALDVKRLEVIKAAVDAEIPLDTLSRNTPAPTNNTEEQSGNEIRIDVEDSGEDEDRKVVRVFPGNRVALLRARHGMYMDGRARFPVLIGVYKDKSILTKVGMDSPRLSSYKSNVDLTKKGELKLRKSNIFRIMNIVFCDLFVASLPLFYLFRIRDSEADRDTIAGVVAAIFTALAIPALPLWFKIFTGSYKADLVVRLHREATPSELWRQAKKIGTKKAFIDTLWAESSRERYRPEALHFIGKDVIGEYEFEYKIPEDENDRQGRDYFRLNDLLEAG